MVQATMFEAKSKLSELVRKARAGETVILTLGKERVPVAKITPFEEPPVQRIGARAIPGWELPESFWEPLPEAELRLWEGYGD